MIYYEFDCILKRRDGLTSVQMYRVQILLYHVQLHFLTPPQCKCELELARARAFDHVSARARAPVLYCTACMHALYNIIILCTCRIRTVSFPAPNPRRRVARTFQVSFPDHGPIFTQNPVQSSRWNRTPRDHAEVSARYREGGECDRCHDGTQAP